MDFANAKRVNDNIKILLTQGVFPGGMAPAVAEALTFIDEATKELAKRVEEANGGQGDGAAADESGLAGSGVHDRKGKGRRRKGNGA